MAIPNSPAWSALTDVGTYERGYSVMPSEGAPGVINYITIGPLALGDSKGRLDSRYWVAYQQCGGVFIAGAVNSKWGEPELIFSQGSDLRALSLAFDQQGRPIVFYQTNDDLMLYWYNPVTNSDEAKFLSGGVDPHAGFDVIYDVGAGYSDAMLFYIKNGIIYMRVQRDRFDVEYETPAKLLKDINIISTGMRVDNRYQVVYRYEDDTYTPPPPVPPVPPALNGDYIYMQASTTQFGLEKPLINSAQHDDISIAFNFYGVNELLETLDPTWGAYGFPIFCEGGTTTIYPIPLWYNMSMHLDILGPQYGYLREAQLKASRKFSLAFMYIDNALYLILVINGKKYGPIMPFNLSDGRWTVAITGNTLTVLNDATTLFTMAVDRGQDGGSEPDPGRFGAYSLGALHNMWRQNFSGALYDITATIAGVETHYPLRTYNSATQPSTPPGNDVTIYNHKPANWKYIAG